MRSRKENGKTAKLPGAVPHMGEETSNFLGRQYPLEEASMAENVIQSGGLTFDAAWLRCRAAASFKRDEALVRIRAQGVPQPILAFFVDADLVRTKTELSKEDAEGTVKVILIDQGNGSATVEVPGEPVSFGPKVVVSSSDLSLDPA